VLGAVRRHLVERFWRLQERLTIERSLQLERSRMLTFAVQFVSYNEMEGDYLEFGVYSGRTFRHCHRAQRLFRGSMHAYLVDSFAGLPEPSGPDADGPFAKGQYAMSQEQLAALFDRQGIPRADYTFVPGFYADLLRDHAFDRLPLERAALVHFDCDLYASARDALALAAPYLQTGTVCLFDDFYCFRARSDRGEQRALREFEAGHPQVRLKPWRPYHWAGMSFFVERASEGDSSKVPAQDEPG